MADSQHSLPRLKGIAADGEIIELPELAEIQLEWDEGLPASVLLNPEHLTGPSLTLEVGSGEDESGALTEYGVIAIRPGASNLLDINIETVSTEEESCGDGCNCQ